MKYVKLTGWGNNKAHLIPLKAINIFSEADKYTEIRLDNGSTINVQESFSLIEELLDLSGAVIYDELDIVDTAGDDAFDVTLYSDGNDLPF